MSSQIFKTVVSKSLFFDFMDSCAIKKTKYYIFSKSVFKKAQYQKLVEPFLNAIKKYYFTSKQYYITRNINYKNFVTIIRQICKYHHIPFTSTIKYDKSTYEISYSIFFDSEQ